jgi:hypothetical protein
MIYSKIEITQQFYNLRQAWEIKGGCAWNTFKNTRFLQPKGGLYEGHSGGKGIFFHETIEEWLPLQDDQFPAYHRLYRTGAKPRNRIKTANKLSSVQCLFGSA